MRLALLLLAALTATAAAEPAQLDIRPVTGFHGIASSAVVDIDVVIGPTTRVELTGPRAWIDRLETTVTSDGILELKMPGHVTNAPKLHAQITVPALDSLRLSGVGDATVGRLAAKSFAVSLSGVGSITLRGGVDALALKLSGTGDIHARDLAAKTADVSVSGVGNAQIRATDTLDAHLSGMGDIAVAGHPPTVHRHVSGMGNITLE